MRKQHGFLVLAWVLAACAAPGQRPTEPTAVAGSFESGVLMVLSNNERQFILPYDYSGGQPLAGFEPIEGTPAARSTDGRLLATVETHGLTCESYAGGSACRPTARALRLVDVSGWREVAQLELPPNGWVGPVVLSLEGTRVALAHQTVAGSTLLVADALTGQVEAERPIGFEPSVLAFGPTGETLAVYGLARAEEPGETQPGPPEMAVFDAATLQTTWEHSFSGLLSGDWCLAGCDATHEARLTAYWKPAVVAARDGRKLHIVHAEADRLTSVDLEGLTVRSVEVAAAQSWVERLLALTAGTAEAKGPIDGAYKSAVLSADGTRLYVAGQAWDSTLAENGQWEISEEALGLHEIDVESGRILAWREVEAGDLSLTADGKYLVLNAWADWGAWLVEADSLEADSRLAGWQVVPARRVDGQPLLLGSRPGDTRTQMGWIDPVSFEVLNSWSVEGYAYWLAAR